MKWGIRKKLMIFLLLATILPFGSSIVLTYFQTIHHVNKESVAYNTELMKKGKEELGTYLEDIALMSTVLYRYTPFMNVLTQGVGENNKENMEEVRRVLAYVYNSRSEIEQMHLYINKGRDSVTNYHSRISGRGENKNIYFHPYYRRLEESETNYSLIEPPHTIYSYNGLSIIPNSEKSTVLSLHNKIRNVPSNDILGFMSIDINLSKIDGIVNRLYKDKEGISIINENGTVIYSSNKAVIGKKTKDKWFYKVQTNPQQNNIKWESKDFSGVIFYENIAVQDNNWYMVKSIPYSSLYQGARATAFMNTMIALVALIIVLVITMIISFKITAPIKVLMENMKKVEKGIFVANFEAGGNDEIGMLGRRFKSMVLQINRLIDKEYKLQIENKSAQLKVLQSQINPHFLYNSFQSIGTLALKMNAVPVYTLLTSLSDMMRYSMDMREAMVPLSKELKHTQSYLSLQKQRFEDELNIILIIEPSTHEIVVPKMLLQPIIENCFKHGFSNKMEGARITIRAYTEDDDLVIIVEDNGIGVSSERLQTIHKKLYYEERRKEDKERESIGLNNIYDRLQLYYEGQASFVIDSIEKKEFTVMIRIPIISHEGVNEDEGTNR
ncbi:sensor histidine kinase [Niallia circulans]|jgi:two-component system, sensor histidine kinase YesM|uniref:Histidine kinase n=2 Tax=Bacillaceae TaxID=186817 RepID=A0A0J1LCZ1_NIACI|nr:sensor histidine kinase [Niallia circulans]KLV26825.1 histidine kinase [Niallia circulans]MDR4318361.1 sensor histidine kinase [Niallia circulans]MED4242333.1 sensor histidine kinase [Niallia circulans]MED5103228.1 sensor histidine kinase [Niallia circulans]PAD23609.1 sensor histidine kinase [Niallia circulans]